MTLKSIREVNNHMFEMLIESFTEDDISNYKGYLSDNEVFSLNRRILTTTRLEYEELSKLLKLTRGRVRQIAFRGAYKIYHLKKLDKRKMLKQFPKWVDVSIFITRENWDR